MKSNKSVKGNAGRQDLEKGSGLPARLDAHEYASWLADLKRRYRQQQVKAAVHVNHARLEF